MDPVEVGVFHTKTHLSEIIRRVEAGERFYITHRGRRVAELRPVVETQPPFERGCARNDGYFMAADFDEPLEDLGDYT
ncbi:MAG: type II toxin-antitoxin system prevent-host-death family antitoxin [Deltaproteobacteria bacterium]|nr:type II toxin-antitoxin system prevent-host-death family antitoxin [Deltaproteobacteria bacterium]